MSATGHRTRLLVFDGAFAVVAVAAWLTVRRGWCELSGGLCGMLEQHQHWYVHLVHLREFAVAAMCTLVILDELSSLNRRAAGTVLRLASVLGVAATALILTLGHNIVRVSATGPPALAARLFLVNIPPVAAGAALCAFAIRARGARDVVVTMSRSLQIAFLVDVLALLLIVSLAVSWGALAVMFNPELLSDRLLGGLGPLVFALSCVAGCLRALIQKRMVRALLWAVLLSSLAGVVWWVLSLLGDGAFNSAFVYIGEGTGAGVFTLCEAIDRRYPAGKRQPMHVTQGERMSPMR